MDAHPHARSRLHSLVVSGLAWKGISQISTQVIRLGVAVVLARILAPHDFGLAGMVLVFTSFILVLSDLALGSRLVQLRELTDIDCSTAFWTSVVSGAVFTVVGIALSGEIAHLFGEPALQPMIAVLSITFFFSGITLTQSALLVRKMAFRPLEIREMAGTFVGGALGIAVALLGYGAWAIIAQQLSSAVVSTILVWSYSTWRPKLAFSLESLRVFSGFSGNVLGASLFWQLRGTSDNFLIGKFIGASALGAYALAYNIILVPFNRIAIPLSQVLFPAMAHVQDDRERLRSYWIRSVRVVATIALPSLLGLIIVAPDFVHAVLGDSWSRATPVIRLLAVVGLLQTLQFLNPTVLQAVDRTSRLFAWSAFSYAAALAAFVVGLQWGIVGVAAAFAIAAVIVEPLYAAMTARTVQLPLRDLVGPLRGVVEASAAFAALLVAARMLLIDVGVGPTLRLLVLIPAGAATFALLCRWRAPEVVAELRGLRPRRRQVDVSLAPEPAAPSSAAARGA